MVNLKPKLSQHIILY